MFSVSLSPPLSLLLVLFFSFLSLPTHLSLSLYLCVSICVCDTPKHIERKQGIKINN